MAALRLSAGASEAAQNIFVATVWYHDSLWNAEILIVFLRLRSFSLQEAPNPKAARPVEIAMSAARCMKFHDTTSADILTVCLCLRSFALQEAQRVPLQRGQWKCGICGQTVRGSHHLDAHMEDEHQDQLIEVRMVEPHMKSL